MQSGWCNEVLDFQQMTPVRLNVEMGHSVCVRDELSAEDLHAMGAQHEDLQQEAPDIRNTEVIIQKVYMQLVVAMCTPKQAERSTGTAVDVGLHNTGAPALNFAMRARKRPYFCAPRTIPPHLLACDAAWLCLL